MTKEQAESITAMLRQHISLMADMITLTGILQASVDAGRPVPKEWMSILEKSRNSAHYRSLLERYEPLLSRFEQAGADNDLIAMIQKMSEGKLPN
jgi:hypothetical protein